MSEKKKVLIIVENLPVPFDRRVWQEALALKKAGYCVSIIAPKKDEYNKSYEELEKIHIYRHPLPFEGSGWKGYLCEYSIALFYEFVLSFRVLRERGFDVIQACNPPDNIFIIGLFYKIFFNKKFVFDHHDINPELYQAKFNKKDLLYKILLFLERLTFKVADVSIATNNSYKYIAVQRGKMPKEKVHIVRSGPSLERVKMVPQNERWKKGRKFLIGYVGVMGKQEGLDHLLEVMTILINKKKREDVQLICVGGGTELNNLKDLAENMNIEEYVTFTGRIPDKVLLEILCTADICVNPDVANEMNDKSTMNKIMEYMALGKPIVQYELSEGKFSAQDASLYAKANDREDFAEKIDYLLNNPELRKRMGVVGYERVYNELHWGKEEPKYLAVYKEVFNT